MLHLSKPLEATMNPFSVLPHSVADSVFERLSLASLAACSLACQAWRHLPYRHMPRTLIVQNDAQVNGVLAAGLHQCSHVHAIHVSSSSDPIWPSVAAQLAMVRLPALREIHIQHSSQTNVTQLEQLRQILQVQGPTCMLHLAITDKASLQALLTLLPLPGLISLELNVPYLADGMEQLLLQAAETQAACLAETSHQAQQPQQHHQQHGYLKVGLWVCCWGGCTGVSLTQALKLHQQLQQVPHCIMTGCEAMNISCWRQLLIISSQLRGLQSLGLNIVSDRGDTSGTSESLVAAAQHQDDDGGGGDADRGTGSADSSTAAFSSSAPSCSSRLSGSDRSRGLSCLAALSPSLKQLSIRGRPSSGWGYLQQPSKQKHQQEVEEQQLQPPDFMASQPDADAVCWSNILVGLTGLTKLSLLKDWAHTPLCVGPIARMTLLQELALERKQLSHPSELSCLSALSGLKVLSLVLTVTAEELLDGVEQGKWQLAAPCVEAMQAAEEQLQQEQQQGCQTAVQQQLCQQVDGVVQSISKLQFNQDQADQQVTGTPGVCNCCCSTGHQATSATAATTATTAASRTVEEMQHQVCLCAYSSNAGNLELLDWQWLLQMKFLQVAWLQVPHINLACLPSSLVELDAQQPNDPTRVSITCSTISSSSSGRHRTSSQLLCLPNLQRLVLPQPLQVQPSGTVLHHATHEDFNMNQGQQPDADACSICSTDDGDRDSPCGSPTDTHEEDADADPACQSLLQSHFEALLLLKLAASCPELQECELVQWRPPVAAVLAAAEQLKYLKLLSFVPAGQQGAGAAAALQEAVREVRRGCMRPLELKLQRPLVLSTFPWSSVLNMQ